MSTANLVPLGLGELLDRTFSYFRKHFWLFAGIMVLPQGILVGMQILVQVFLSTIPLPHNPQTPQAAMQTMRFGLSAALASLGILIPYYIAYAMALGATTHALSEVYLGRMATIRDSFRVIRRRVGRILHVILSILLRAAGFMMLAGIIFFLIVGAMAVIPKSMILLLVLMGLVAIIGLIAAFVLMIIFLVRYSVAVPALVLEKISARQAIKRSIALTRGYLWRLLLVAFLMVMIQMVLVSLCQAPFSVASMLIMAKGGRPGLWLTIPSVLVGGVGASATAPLLMISFVIAYYDLRVRKEGFDLQLMMAHLDEAVQPRTPIQVDDEARERLEDSTVFGTLILAFITGGIYVPIWFMLRRKALNDLNSSEKIGIVGPAIALAGYISLFLLSVIDAFMKINMTQPDSPLFAVQPAILLVSSIIVVLHCFKARRILLDHLAPRETGMFTAGIRLQHDNEISPLGTFFLGIFYLQYKINRLIDRLYVSEGGQMEASSPESPAMPPSPINP